MMLEDLTTELNGFVMMALSMIDHKISIEESENMISIRFNNGSINLVPEYIIEEMKSLGMPIYTGDSPPKNLENIYLATPLILKGSNISSDVIGNRCHDYYLKLIYQKSNKCKTA